MPPLSPLVWLGAWYVLSGLVTFVAYGWDKRQAQRGGRRVPESRLHLMALLGGFAGGLLGRRTFCHKTLRARFGVVLWLAALLHGALALAIATGAPAPTP